MFLVITGEKMFGEVVPGGISKLLYCQKCKESNRFIEYEGKRFTHIYYIPLWSKGPKCHYLVCTSCATSYEMDYNMKQTEGVNSGVMRDLTSQEKNSNKGHQLEEIRKNIKWF